MREVRDYNPELGFAFQGDVSIIPVPKDIRLDLRDEIQPKGSRLILQEGEVTGHHHAIDLQRPRAIDAMNAQVERIMTDAAANKIPLPSARLYRDPNAVAEMARRGILTRSDLIMGLLIVDVGPMVLSHEEHDGIRIPPGTYLIGNQVESAGAEERRVAD